MSLLPSATELLCFVGGAAALVGRSHECDYPRGIEGIPVLTARATPPGAEGEGPAAIDRVVREQLSGGSSLYTLNAGLLASLQPDLVLTQDLVCSIDLEAVWTVADGLNPRIVSLSPQTVEDVLDDCLTVGEAAGLGNEARRAVVGLRDRLFRAAEYVNPYIEGPRIAFLDWTDPLYVGGHWTPQLIERAGGRHPLNPTVAVEGSGAAVGPQQAMRRAGPSRRVSVEELVVSRPEVLIVSPCGVGLAGVREMARELARQPWWAELPAVRAGRVALVDGNPYFNRPGPRLVEAFEWLVGWLNDRPGVVPVGFAWESIGR